MVNPEAKISGNKVSTQDGILSTEMAIDLPSSRLLCLSYAYQDQDDGWSLPIETVAPAFSCHQ